MDDCLQMTWIEWLFADEINWMHEMIARIYITLFKYITWKHDTDCSDYDTAGEGDGSLRASRSSDWRGHT